MILDCLGRPVRRAIGFMGGFVPVIAILPAIAAADLVGGNAELEEEEADTPHTPVWESECGARN